MAIAMRLRNQLQSVYKLDPLRNEVGARVGRAGGEGPGARGGLRLKQAEEKRLLTGRVVSAAVMRARERC